jgi:Ni/Co efflux regulator RcnB
MKSAIAFLAAAILAAMPAAAQQHQPAQPGGHPATHAPTMHAPATHAPATHAPAMHAPTMHATHPAMHAHVAAHHMTTRHAVRGRVTAHHAVRHVVSHHARAVHHAVRAAARPGHRAPKAAVARLRKNVVAVHRFHAGPYRAPPGWHYRRFVFGERLPGIYFAPAFWITDFLAFDLFPPPDGYVWVRYGPDALLIDRYTGEVIQVDYGVFY